MKGGISVDAKMVQTYQLGRSYLDDNAGLILSHNQQLIKRGLAHELGGEVYISCDPVGVF